MHRTRHSLQVFTSSHELWFICDDCMKIDRIPKRGYRSRSTHQGGEFQCSKTQLTTLNFKSTPQSDHRVRKQEEMETEWAAWRSAYLWKPARGVWLYVWKRPRSTSAKIKYELIVSTVLFCYHLNVPVCCVCCTEHYWPSLRLCTHMLRLSWLGANTYRVLVSYTT